MSVHNSDIAEIFDRLADLLEIKGENPFRVRAYRNAARTVGGLSQNAADMIAENKDMSKLSGIGKDLAGKIREVVETGKLSLLEKTETEVPGTLSDLMHVSGLGAKRIAALHRELDVASLDDLEQAARDGRISKLEGFGVKTQRSMLDEIDHLRQKKEGRTLLARVEQYARPLVEYLRRVKGAKDVVAAGSYRRRRETVGDLDILATCKRGARMMERFVGYDEVSRIVSQGKTRSTVILRSGLQVDLRVVPQVSYGSALVYFTGSKAHNIAIRKIAVKKKLKINEYGVFKGDDRIAGRTEHEVYEHIGLAFVEPEMREDRGEVDLARTNALPALVKLEDIRGDLHMHTQRTDGRHTAEELARAARKRRYEYIAITDHSKRLTVAHGLKPKDLRQQISEIDALNGRLKDFAILKGIEVDILSDGSLDLPDDVLKELDLVIGSVHSKFDLSRDEQTDRILRAMDNRHFSILGHPTGRLLNEREAYDVDMRKLMQAAKDRGCLLELNAHPERLDLNDIHCRMAAEMGVKVVISTDTHRIDDMDLMRFGIDQARRGWLRAEDVGNTRSLVELKKLLER